MKKLKDLMAESVDKKLEKQFDDALMDKLIQVALEMDSGMTEREIRGMIATKGSSAAAKFGALRTAALKALAQKKADANKSLKKG